MTLSDLDVWASLGLFFIHVENERHFMTWYWKALEKPDNVNDVRRYLSTISVVILLRTLFTFYNMDCFTHLIYDNTLNTYNKYIIQNNM